MKDKKILGDWGEKQAAAYLSSKGYTILEKNYRTPYGEIDLVAQFEGVTVFVEVKTRSSSRFGFPEESVNRQKKEHLTSAALFYIQDHINVSGDWRIDVIAISRNSNPAMVEILHFENALEESS